MSRLPSFVSRSSDLKEEIKAEIIKAVDGMYVPLLLKMNTSKLTLGQVSPRTIASRLTNWEESPQSYQNCIEKSPEKVRRIK
jgi:hypothetical protein